MKLNLKEALIRYNILQEGWLEDLSNKYDEDTLIFVGRMLQQAYPNEDISNHKLADWIAKTAKGFGKISSWNDDKKNDIENSYQILLNFIKENDNSIEIINKIKSMSAKQALAYVKKESKKETEEEREINGEEELKEWLDKGLMKIIGRGPKGSFWVKPLKGEFFGVAQCGRLGKGSQDVGEFGIGCQRGEQAGFGAVGFGNYKGDTYSLLAKSKDGYYTTIISLGGNPDRGNFVYHALQFGNKIIGSQNEPNFNFDKEDFINAFVDFLSNNSYGKKIYKDETLNETQNEFGETISNSTSLPYQMVSLENDKKALRKFAQNRPDFVKYYEKALKILLGEEQYALLTIKARELYEKDPKRFVESLPTYLKSEKQETLKILSEINFEEFIRQYGEDVVLKNVESIIKSMSYEKFQELIKPYISYDKFLSNTDKSNIKEIIRSFAEKSQSSKKTLPIIQNIIESEEDFEALIKNFGKGNPEKGLRAFLASLSTPRMSKHKSYVRTPEGVTATVKEPRRDENRNFIDSSNRVIMSGGEVYDEQGNVMDFGGDEQAKNNYVKSRISYEDVKADVKEGQWILDYKSIRKIIIQNKERIIKLLGGGKKGEIGFLELLLRNSSPQERAKELKENEDFYVDYYNAKFERGDSKVPGIIQLGSILAPEKELSTGEKIQTAKRNLNGILRDSFSGPAEFAYIIPKNDYRNNIKYILKFYQNNSKGTYKIVDSASALMDTLLKSKVSIPEIVELSQNFLNTLYSKKANAKALIKFLYNLIHIIPASTTLKKFVLENLKENDIAKKIEQARSGRDPKSGIIKPDMFVSEKYRDIMSVINDIEDDKYDAGEKGDNLQEQEVRKYVRNLLESNFKKKSPYHTQE
jgi:hypothetical protein